METGIDFVRMTEVIDKYYTYLDKVELEYYLDEDDEMINTDNWCYFALFYQCDIHREEIEKFFTTHRRDFMVCDLREGKYHDLLDRWTPAERREMRRIIYSLYKKREIDLETEAAEFWKDLMNHLYKNPDYKGNSGIMSAEHITTLMSNKWGYNEYKINKLLWKCVELNLSDRSCGAFVV